MFLRKFIILNKQGSKDAKGHAKLEVRTSKARLSLTIEGAEGNEDAIYKLYIVSDSSSNFEEVELGTVEVDKRGRGKLDLGFNANAVSKSKLDIADCNILILKREDNLTKESEIILGGYIHKDDDTISKIKSKNKAKSNSREKVEVKDDKENVKSLEKDKLKIKEMPKETAKETPKEAPKETPKETSDIKNTIDEKVDTTKSENSNSNPDLILDLNLEQHEVEELESYLKHCKKYDELSKQEESNSEHYGQQIASYTLDILKLFKRVNPFKIEFEDYKWWQIDHQEMNSHRGFLPYYNYILNSNYQNKGKYASCQSQIKKYNHYLFGMVEKQGKITHYVYAIPGKYERKEHPYGGSTGFVTWLEDKSGGGYWLSYIDAHTGNVVRPR